MSIGLPNGLPNLSEWHPLPARGVIPRGTLYATVYPDGDIVIQETTGDYAPFDGDNRFFTEEPVTVPLPEKFGAMIRITSGKHAGRRAVRVRVWGSIDAWYLDGDEYTGNELSSHQIFDFEVIHDG